VTGETEQLLAGVARVDITGLAEDQIEDPLYAGIDAGRASDRLYAKALVLRRNTTAAVIVTVDAVAIAEIGSIHNDYLAGVRAQLQRELPVEAENVLINASHCHGVVCADIELRTVQAVRSAWQNMVPVHAGVGVGREDGIMENRRLKLKSGGEADVRRAYALPADEEIEAVGPVDPQIGVLRLDRADGQPLAVVYNFACHPIQGVPSGGNTADISGFASQVIESNVGSDAIALFVQGCAANINPILYRDIGNPPDAEPLGNRLGLSVLRALKQIRCEPGAELALINEPLRLPRADLAESIAALEAERQQQLQSLKPTSLNLKTFLHLIVTRSLSPDFPSYDAHRYLHEEAMGRDDLRRLDRENQRDVQDYSQNIRTMERLTRTKVNVDLLKMHQARNAAAGECEIQVEVVGLRVGEFVLIAFPGELSVEIGLHLKETSPHLRTFVAGVSNGYIYYTPTAEQLQNRGGAQEDSDCLVAPEWQARFQDKAMEILQRL